MMQAEISRVQTIEDEVPAKPLLAPNVQLLGEMPDTGFIDRQWLIQRNGRFIQLSELLYRVAENANGKRTLEEMAASVTATTKWLVEADDVRQLVKSKLLPLGVVSADGPSANAEVTDRQQARSPLQLNLKMKVLGPRLIDPITSILRFLYLPGVLIPVLIAIAVAHVWVYVIHGVGPGIRGALYTPGGLLAVLSMVILSGTFHEFGHASALRYSGGKVRGMGVGLYLIYPAFYTDVTDSYRLGRSARLRTDLGGVYFHMIFALGLIALSVATGSELLLFAVLIIDVEILRQFIPFARLDGYWVLADLTGVPDFFSQMGPFLRSLQPKRIFGGDRLPDLKPWVRRVFAFYTLVTIPLLASLYLLMLIKLPAFLAQTWDALLVQKGLFSGAAAGGRFLLMAACAAQMLLLALPALGSMYIIYSALRKPLRSLWRWTERERAHRTVLRASASTCTVAACLIVAAIGWNQHLRREAEKRAALEARLERVGDVTAKVETLQADLEGSAGSNNFVGTLLLMRPNLARIHVKGQAGLSDYLVVSDGKELWTYFPADNKLVKSIPGKMGGNIHGLLVDQVNLFFHPGMISIAGKNGTFTNAGKETIDGVSYEATEWAIPGPPKKTVRYLISPTDGIVRRVVETIQQEKGEVSVRWIGLKNVRTNQSVDESAFRWSPPATASLLQMPIGQALPKQ